MSTRTKIAITILLAILFFLAFQAYGEGRQSRAHLLRTAKLAYADTNKNYFGDKLTKDVEIKFVDNLKSERTGEDVYATTLCISTENGLHCVMQIDPYYNNAENTVIWTVSHEMCHIKLHGIHADHGEPFQACMQEGAALGEFRDVW